MQDKINIPQRNLRRILPFLGYKRWSLSRHQTGLVFIPLISSVPVDQEKWISAQATGEWAALFVLSVVFDSVYRESWESGEESRIFVFSQLTNLWWLASFAKLNCMFALRVAIPWRPTKWFSYVPFGCWATPNIPIKQHTASIFTMQRPIPPSQCCSGLLTAW